MFFELSEIVSVVETGFRTSDNSNKYCIGSFAKFGIFSVFSNLEP